MDKIKKIHLTGKLTKSPEFIKEYTLPEINLSDYIINENTKCILYYLEMDGTLLPCTFLNISNNSLKTLKKHDNVYIKGHLHLVENNRFTITVNEIQTYLKPK